MRINTFSEGIGVAASTVFGWYREKTLLDKNITLICSYLDISKDVFYDPGKVSIKEKLDNTIGHEGQRLELLLQEKHIDITAISKILGVSRPTVYKLFTQAELPDDILLKAANYFNLPTSYFSGSTKPIFKDNDIWQLLRDILGKVDGIRNQIDLLAKKELQ